MGPIPGSWVVKTLPANAGDTGDSGSNPGSGSSPGKGNGDPLQNLAWKIPWTEKRGRLQFMRLQRVGHDLAIEHICIYLWSVNLQQRRQKYTEENRQSLQQVMLVNLDSYRYMSEIRTFPNTIYKNKILSLLQGIFPTQGLNPGLPHCRQIFYQLSHKGNSRILE